MSNQDDSSPFDLLLSEDTTTVSLDEAMGRKSESDGYGLPLPDLMYGSSHMPAPMVETVLSPSTIESLDEMRHTDQVNAARARRDLAVEGYNETLKDLFGNKRVRSVMIDQDGKRILIGVQAHNSVRTMEWSLERAQVVIPGDVTDVIPDKVIGILDDLDVRNPKSQEVVGLIVERAARDALARRHMSTVERAAALRRYNQMAQMQFATKTVVDLHIDKRTYALVLEVSFAQRLQRTTWTFDRDGRFF